MSALIEDADRPVVLSSDAITGGGVADPSSANGAAADFGVPSDDAARDHEVHDGAPAASSPSGESAGGEDDPLASASATGGHGTAADGVGDAIAEAGLPPSGYDGQVVRDGAAPTLAQLRIDFGAHLEANYRRLVAQLYAITLDPAEAHSVVQDAYSRAWQSWVTVSRTPDPTGWVRRVAVRSTMRSWRRFRLRSRPLIGPGVETSVGALLAALHRLPPPERRCVVLHHMAGVSLPEIAAVEGVSVGTTAARLSRAQHDVNAGLVDVLSDEFGLDDPNALDGWATPEWDTRLPEAEAADDEEDQP
ncbi:MAG TPA: sigma factor-like helix-turn-helix DNA-binding protein [Pseudonocardia sp.]